MNSTNKVGILEENHPVDIKNDDSQANVQGGFYHDYNLNRSRATLTCLY